MADKKGWGSTVMGWFVEFDEGAPAPGTAKPAPSGPDPDAAADDIIRRYAGGGAGRPSGRAAPKAGPEPDRAPARSPSGEVPPDFGSTAGPAKAAASVPTVGEGGKIDFPEVFRSAGVTDAEADQVRRALELLAQLPAETPHAVKKQIVETSLKTFGVKIEAIIESAVAEIEALHGCIQAGATATATLLSDSEARIATLQQEIADVRQVMAAREAEQRALESQARAHGLEVQKILEFFGQELVGKVVKESPRLHEPGKPG